MTLQNRIDAAPRTASIWPTIEAAWGGATSSTSLRIRNTGALITSAERIALAGAGAPAWAGGSHRCSGNSAALARSPTIMSASAAKSAGSPRLSRDSASRSSVPYCP
ncbi:hypothetical protein D3C87_1806340 [compost metagenome]